MDAARRVHCEVISAGIASDHVQTRQQGYWAQTLGPEDLEGLARYLKRQRIHHDDSNPAELWQFGKP